MPNNDGFTIIGSAQSAPAQRDKANSRFNQLFETSLAIDAENAWDNNEVGYICRTLVQATLPYREPKNNPPAWGRTNGRVSLVLQPGYAMRQVKTIAPNGKEHVSVEPVCLGYPYGSIPRLVVAWIGREVKQKKEREIDLGPSLTCFMQDLGLNSATGGKNGSITRLKEQMRRMFAARIALLDNPDVNSIDWKNASYQLADKTQIWWESKDDPQQPGLFSSRVLLSENFFKELMESPVPLDMRALRVLKNSPSALDLYCYLTYRFFALRNRTTVPWAELKQQFGSEVSNPRKFKWQFAQALKSVLAVYDCKVDLAETGLILSPSKTSVPKIARS